MNKQKFLDTAELVDSFRIIPLLLFLTACFWWTVVVTRELLFWYMKLPHDERSLEASGFASVVFLTVFGFLKLVYSEYASSGRDWDAAAPQAVTTTTTATQTVQR